jgi:nucleotide-binding universal stress UspA family protein
MSYKTILVHVDESKRAAERIKLAAKLTVINDGHLIGVALTGISRLLFKNGMPENDPNLTVHLEWLRERATQALNEFDPIVQMLGITSYERRIIDDEAGGGMSLAARYGDLAVIGQTNPDEPSPAVPPDFPEFVVMNAGRPVLIVPYAGEFDTLGKRILVAWDASIEAARAVTGAIPLLKCADMVDVLIFNPPTKSEAQSEPGADLIPFLARHGIKAEVSQQRTEIDIGDALLSRATDLFADLIVMGAYGHSRFREVLLGGTTRTVLTSMTVPVLMSH